MDTAFDHRLKYLSNLNKFTQSRDEALDLANQYDEHVIIPALERCGRSDLSNNVR